MATLVKTTDSTPATPDASGAPATNQGASDSPDAQLFGNVPKKGATAAPARSFKGSAAITHTVAPGETLEYIASIYYDEVTERTVKGLWSANVDRLREPSALTVGVNLVIPAYNKDWQDDEYWDVKESPRTVAYWASRSITPPAL